MDPTTSNVTEQPLKEIEAKDPPPIQIQPIKKKRKKSRKIPRAKGAILLILILTERSGSFILVILGFPKFPKNGYVRFCDEMRPIVCGENANMDPGNKSWGFFA